MKRILNKTIILLGLSSISLYLFGSDAGRFAPSKYNIQKSSFMQVYIKPELFDDRQDLYVELRGYFGSGNYRRLYYSKSRGETFDTSDSIYLEFSKKFRSKYKLDECSNKVVDVVGRVYKNNSGLGYLKDIIAVRTTKLNKNTLQVDSSKCYFDET